MEGEMGASARIAIALIVLAVLMAVIFVILGFTRGATNEGITSVQNSMDAMQVSQFDDYDQKSLSGAQVSSAIKLMEGKPIAMVVVNTKQNVNVGMDGASAHFVSTPTHINEWSNDAGSGGTGNCRFLYKQETGTVGVGTGILKNDGNELDWKGTNYGALLKGSFSTYDPYDILYRHLGIKTITRSDALVNDEANILAIPDTNIDGLFRATDMSYYIGLLILNGDGTIPVNNQTLKTRQSGSDWFIRGTSKYMSRLIRDTTGSIIGVCFIQTA